MDATALSPDEITKSLKILGVHTWEDFITLNGAHLGNPQKKANHKLVDVLKVSKDKVILLHDLIMDSKVSRVPDWDNPARHTQELCCQHVYGVIFLLQHDNYLSIWLEVVTPSHKTQET